MVQGRQKRKMRIFSRYHRGSRYFRIDTGVPGQQQDDDGWGKDGFWHVRVCSGRFRMNAFHFKGRTGHCQGNGRTDRVAGTKRSG